jgi:hypothetical protein
LFEDQWVRAKRAGMDVTVKMVPRYDDEAVRPSTIDVSWEIDGRRESLKFRNERREKRGGK